MSRWIAHLLLAVLLLQPLVAAAADCCERDSMPAPAETAEPSADQAPCHGEADAHGSDSATGCNGGVGCIGCQASACGHAVSAMVGPAPVQAVTSTNDRSAAPPSLSLLPGHALTPLRPPSIS